MAQRINTYGGGRSQNNYHQCLLCGWWVAPGMWEIVHEEDHHTLFQSLIQVLWRL